MDTVAVATNCWAGFIDLLGEPVTLDATTDEPYTTP